MSNSEIIQSLQEKFYANIPFPLPRSQLEEAVFAFFKFLEEPEDIKTHIDFKFQQLHRRGEVGYRIRVAEDDVYNDNKEFFHYHPALFKRYPDFIERNVAVKDFVLKAKPIWEKAAEVIKNVLQTTFEPLFPGIIQKIFDTEDVHIMLRFLKYDWQSSGKYLAKPHFDAGSFTLALAESGPGLRIGSHTKNLQLVPYQPNNAVFMISSNYRKIMDTETLLPGWHDVIQLDESIIGRPYSRWVVVAFIEAHGVEALPRSETHKYSTIKRGQV